MGLQMGGSLTMNIIIITLASLLLSSLVLIQGKGFGAALNGGKSLNGPELSVNSPPVERMSLILQEAYPLWMPTTAAHHTYEQLHQEAFPVLAWTTMVRANLIQMRDIMVDAKLVQMRSTNWGTKEVRWNQN